MLHKDKNPYLNSDKKLELDARKAADVLWEATDGDLSGVPSNYLESLKFSYSDGTVSRLHELNKVDFSEGATYEDFSQAVNTLIRVKPEKWPDPEYTETIQPSKLQHSIDPEFSEEDFDLDFAEGDDLSNKMELFLKKVIASVYLDGITSVTDKDGNPPNSSNNYLMAPDGKSFAGIFYDSPPGATAKKFPFKISEKGEGKWQIRY